MPVCFVRCFVLACAGTLLVCVMLFLLSGFPVWPALICCGGGMDMPFSCLIALLSLFSTIAVVFASLQRLSFGVLSHTVPSKRFGHLTDRLFSDYFRGWFAISLLLGAPLVLLGAALLFSLSLRFDPSAVYLGSLSVVGGLLLPFLSDLPS